MLAVAVEVPKGFLQKHLLGGKIGEGRLFEDLKALVGSAPRGKRKRGIEDAIAREGW